jgi:diaminohydroxyphosphoribosylaminopyrimidine deaminase/5-amino-6-(5-phosphoribosylamino)uracil reductase
MCGLTMAEAGTFTEADRRWMAEAIELSVRGIGRVEPNPAVGAVVVDRAGACVGRGYHAVFGGPHAEIRALERAGAAARGGTLYVTLEPCCHHGKTGPCTEAILGAGIRRVVCPCTDPSPLVNGRGVERLRAGGIAVDVGCMQPDARRANNAYFVLVECGRPLVIAKWAQTRDGLIAAPRLGRWISGETARAEAHRLRAICQGILVGAGTVRTDDPELTVRRVAGRNPHRLVLSGRLDFPLDCRLVRTAVDVPVTVLTCGEAASGQPAKVRELQSAGIEVLALGDAPLVSWDELLAELGRRRITRLLVEGGAGVLRGLFEARAADRVAIFTAPVDGGEGLALWPDGRRPGKIIDPVERRLGPDTLIEGKIEFP